MQPATPPPALRPSAAIRAYLRDPAHLKHVLAVLGGGYAAALAVWEAMHSAALEDYILSNQFAPGARPSLALLLAGAVLALFAWLGLGMVYGARRMGELDDWLSRAAGAFLALALLPFLPILALDGIADHRPWLTLGLIAFMAVLAGLAATTARWPRSDAGLRRRLWHGRIEVGLLAAVGLTAGYAIFMSWLTIARHNAFLTHSFDLGIHDQALYNLLRSGVMRSTQYGAEAINYIGDHFSPIFYLVAPLYALYQDARMLLILQSIALGIGAIAVYLLGRRLTENSLFALALSFAYVLYPALHGTNTFDFHQIALATPLLLFALYFLESGRDRAFFIALLLALLVKEEVALTIVGIGLYLIVGKRRPRLGTLLAVGGLVYFAVVTQLIMPALGGAPQVNRFAAMMAPGEDGMSAVARTLLTNPFYTLKLVFSVPDRLLYLTQLLLPILFLPLLGGSAWLAAVPAIAVSLLTTAETQYSIAYHYSAAFIPFAFYLAARGARAALSARRESSGGSRPLVSAGALAAGIIVAALATDWSFGWLFSQKFYASSLPAQHAAAVRACFADIPRSASVSAMSDLVPHLSGRRDIYLFPIVNDAEYIVFDADPTANPWPFIESDGRLDALRALAPHVISGEYGVIRAENGCIVLRRGQDTTSNGAAVREMLSARYEAEDLRSNFPDSIVADPRASEGRARRAESSSTYADEQNALTFGPYQPLFPGRYRVEYLLRQENATSETPLVTADIFSNSAGGALAGRDIFANDFAAADSYIALPVEVELRDFWPDLEYRVLFHGPGAVIVDQVRLIPQAVDAPAGSYEAEGTAATGAFPVAEDETARGGRARQAPASAPAGALAEFAVGSLIPGDYRADFVLKLDETDATGPIASLEIISEGNTLAQREISAADFAASGQYQPIALDFGSDRPLSNVVLRIRATGAATLWADAVDLIYHYQGSG